MVDFGRDTHDLCELDAPYEPDAVLRLFEGCNCFVSDKGMIGGREVPLIHGDTPAVNMAAFWDSTDGNAWNLLKAHEDTSDLPSAVSVVVNNERAAGIERALKIRGYQPVETLWVKKS